ncbi:MAG: hypothetical protein IMZ61_06555 [Planctomycetes bacterium]|nr:hypothetical protein [Planctomycetota bacterium]
MSVDSKEAGIALLASSPLVSLASAAETVLYTCPTGKVCIITDIIVRTPSASLASVSSVAFGSNAGTRNDWDASARTLALITTTALSLRMTQTLPGDSADQVTTILTAGDTFGIYVTTGAAVTATIDVFGYLYDA